MTFRKLILIAATTLTITTLALGCGQATEPAAQDVVEKAVAAYSSVQTVKMDMSMSMNMEAVGGEQPTNIRMDMDADGSMNVKETELSLTMTADMDIPEMGNQNLSTDIYVVDGWMYMKMDIPVVGEVSSG